MDIHFFDHTIEQFITLLEKPTIAKVLRTLDLLETFGNKLSMPHSKPLKDGLFELRVRGVHEVRIIYTFHQKNIILLHGFIKKTDKIPAKELKLALEKRRDLE